VVLWFQNNKGDVYHAIKKLCYIEAPTPSQVVTMTVLTKAKNLGAIATKVVAQMAAKL
jgi:aubergine-like protein